MHILHRHFILNNKMREKLVEVFLQKNKELNLSAIRDEEGVMVKHIQDSLELKKTWVFKDWMEVADVWTGGGFPLMPLAISYPNIQFTGIDSVKKKTVAVNEMLDTLWVKNAKVIWTRIEEYKEKQFDVVTARAVAYSDKLIKWAYPLLKKWWYFLFMKQNIQEERELLLKLCKKYHLSLKDEIKYQLYEWDIDRIIYVIEKE